MKNIKDNEDFEFLCEALPFGIIKFSCEKQPKVIYITSGMKKLLQIPEDSESDYELYENDIFLLIPMEERKKFSAYLNKVSSSSSPVSGEITILRFDGSKGLFLCYTLKSEDEDGGFFKSVLIDVTENRREKAEMENRRYLKALTEVYDKIFRYDLLSGTVTCLYSNSSSMFKPLENIPMQMEEATERWITDTVIDSERAKVKAFFEDFRKKTLYKKGTRPPQITYHAKSSTGEIKTYGGIFLKTDETVSFYCCRTLSDENKDSSYEENLSIKENMHRLIMHFSEGIAAFEVTDNFVTPLYLSDNVTEFFGFNESEWIPLMENSTPIKEFVSKSKVDFSEFAELLRTGEKEFSYYDINLKRERRIKAICSPKAPSSSPRYVLLFNMEQEKEEEKKVRIRTFGYFDVFVNNRPIAFSSKKAKELFALLVDRRGGFVTSQEAISFLWEDEPINSRTLANYRKIAMRLKNTLEEYSAADIIETVDGKRRIITEKVQCDLYDYLSGKDEYQGLFKGSYLSNYSWAETTLAELTGNILY